MLKVVACQGLGLALWSFWWMIGLCTEKLPDALALVLINLTVRSKVYFLDDLCQSVDLVISRIDLFGLDVSQSNCLVV